MLCVCVCGYVCVAVAVELCKWGSKPSCKSQHTVHPLGTFIFKLKIASLLFVLTLTRKLPHANKFTYD